MGAIHASIRRPGAPAGGSYTTSGAPRQAIALSLATAVLAALVAACGPSAAAPLESATPGDNVASTPTGEDGTLAPRWPTALTQARSREGGAAGILAPEASEEAVSRAPGGSWAGTRTGPAAARPDAGSSDDSVTAEARRGTEVGGAPAPSAAASAPESPPGAVPAALQPSTGADAARGPGERDGDLARVAHVWQKWNNCGPSSLLMGLSVFGIERDQLALAARLKPDREDTNVTPDELAVAAREEGLGARARVGGDMGVVRSLIELGLPVLAEQWIDVEGRGEMGHYRLVTAYSDAEQAVVTQDSYYGANRRYGYADFERMWTPFAGAYVVLYPPRLEAEVRSALGESWDDAAMWRRALERYGAQATAEPGNAWPRFAVGESLSALGEHEGAVRAYEEAEAIGLPMRTYWYQFGHYRSLVALEQYERVVALADRTLATMKGENLEESRYWRGVALRGLGREDEARAEFETALRFNPRYEPARAALEGLSP